MDTHARLLDRRRFELLFGDGDPEGVLAALADYANADGGFGWALHPDLPSASSQPVGVLNAFEVLEEVAPSTSPLAARLSDWLDGVSLANGGLPFALPGTDGPGSATDYCQQDKSADAAAQLERLGFSPEPDRPLRALRSAEVVADDLGRLAPEQREDGGWDVHFRSSRRRRRSTGAAMRRYAP